MAHPRIPRILWLGFPRRTPDPALAGPVEQRGDGGEPLGMTGSENHGKIRIDFEQPRPGVEQGGLFTLQGAAGDQESHGARVAAGG